VEREVSKPATARDTIEKARYFLEQAQNAERDVNISSARLPFIATLEAAIISGRSTLDHLRNEFASKPGYRQWHDAEWQRLMTCPLFIFLNDRRQWIVHRAAEKVNLTFNVSVVMSASARVVCDAIVIRGQPWYRRSPKILWRDWMDSRAARRRLEEPVKDPPTQPQPGPEPQTQPEQIFYFADPDWKSKPARLLVAEYIDLMEQVVAAAESRFG
jgi:hypothetical protein